MSTKKFLDLDGLSRVWNKISGKFAVANEVINATDLTVSNRAVNLVTYVNSPGIYKVPSSCWIYTDSASSTANRIFAQAGDIVKIDPQLDAGDGEEFVEFDSYFTVFGTIVYAGSMITADNVTWTSSVVPYEHQGNKVTTISSSSRNTQYPSAKAVYDYAAQKAIYSDSSINLGRKSNTTVGTKSVAFGNDATASGNYSCAEGSDTVASGTYSHSEGIGTAANGTASHSEGNSTVANYEGGHAEGVGCVADGFATHVEGEGSYGYAVSHAEGLHTISSCDGQHAGGRYNIEDENGDYANIIGNGYYDSENEEEIRSNAHTVDWSGNGWFSGDVYTGSTSGTNKDAGSKKLATEDYVEQLTRDGVQKVILYNGKATGTAVLTGAIQELSDSIFNYDLLIVGINCNIGSNLRRMEFTQPVFPHTDITEWCDTTGAGANGAFHMINCNTGFGNGNGYRVMFGFTDATHIRNIVSNPLGSWGDAGICYVIGYKFSALPDGYMQEPTTEGTSGQVLTTDGNGGRTWTTVSGGGGGVGQDLTGQTVSPTSSGTVTAGTNAEIFNDYRARTFSGTTVTAGNVASGNYSHAEGTFTTASGLAAHAEGRYSKATNEGSHAECNNTTASGYYSHAEGSGSTASGLSAHAEGGTTVASGTRSHTEGTNTTAQTLAQHVQGEYNVLDTGGTATTRGTYADIVGNGTSTSARSNAYTLDWSGNGWFAGDVYTGSTSGTDKDAGSKKLATEDYVNNKITYGTSDLTAGTSALTTGTLYFVYE